MLQAPAGRLLVSWVIWWLRCPPSSVSTLPTSFSALGYSMMKPEMLGRAPVCGTGSFLTCVDTSLCSPIPLPQRGTPRKTWRPWKSLRSSHRKWGLYQRTWPYLSRWVRTHITHVPFSVRCATCNPVTLMSPTPGGHCRPCCRSWSWEES